MVSDIFPSIVLSRNYVTIRLLINKSVRDRLGLQGGLGLKKQAGSGQRLSTAGSRAGRARSSPGQMAPPSLRTGSCFALLNETMTPPRETLTDCPEHRGTVPFFRSDLSTSGVVQTWGAGSHCEAEGTAAWQLSGACSGAEAGGPCRRTEASPESRERRLPGRGS